MSNSPAGIDWDDRLKPRPDHANRAILSICMIALTAVAIWILVYADQAAAPVTGGEPRIVYVTVVAGQPAAIPDVLVVIAATSTPAPTAWRTPTEQPTPTAPACEQSGVGWTCEWSATETPIPTLEPIPTETPLPVCVTPNPGERCQMQDRSTWPIVPDLHDLPVGVAVATVEALGYQPVIYCSGSKQGPADIVLGQLPAPGEQYPPGWEVTLALAKPCPTNLETPAPSGSPASGAIWP